ncbi:hypothetical protein Tasa_021_013 [Tanticharoenia sakaeratensis NBRC 103193]|uniref:Uncharacterized protein n=1 Tax=Tanticharoenia sakaeratensis NBRC 103193 TaxID=1231623 RepID=A0A0D6MLB0_9PROT|nr:hypothetical protein Tasa_021_013 [Tanticharoenia sakaeratensis NBRC 103193]
MRGNGRLVRHIDECYTNTGIGEALSNAASHVSRTDDSYSFNCPDHDDNTSAVSDEHVFP